MDSRIRPPTAPKTTANRGIHRMIDEDIYCIDILTQIGAPDFCLGGPRSWPLGRPRQALCPRREDQRGFTSDHPTRQALRRGTQGKHHRQDSKNIFRTRHQRSNL